MTSVPLLKTTGSVKSSGDQVNPYASTIVHYIHRDIGERDNEDKNIHSTANSLHIFLTAAFDPCGLCHAKGQVLSGYDRGMSHWMFSSSLGFQRNHIFVHSPHKVSKREYKGTIEGKFHPRNGRSSILRDIWHPPKGGGRHDLGKQVVNLILFEPLSFKELFHSSQSNEGLN